MVCDINTIHFLYKKSDHVISPNGFILQNLVCECKFISRHIVALDLKQIVLFPISVSFERRDLFLLFIYVNV